MVKHFVHTKSRGRPRKGRGKRKKLNFDQHKRKQSSNEQIKRFVRTAEKKRKNLVNKIDKMRQQYQEQYQRLQTENYNIILHELEYSSDENDYNDDYNDQTDYVRKMFMTTLYSVVELDMAMAKVCNLIQNVIDGNESLFVDDDNLFSRIIITLISTLF